MVIEKVKETSKLMLKKILLFGLLIAFANTFAQHTVTGKMTPKNKHSWVILYRLDGVKQKYVDNASADKGNFSVKDGTFSVKIPKGAATGMYRLLYDNKKNLFIDFIYNNEDVAVEFHPEHPVELVKYTKSVENKTFQNYMYKASTLQNTLDSIQVVYFQTKDKAQEKALQKLYTKELQKLKATQNASETESKGKIASIFITANKRFYANNLIKDTKEYLNTIKSHYFDNVDFNNPVLLKSSLLIDRVMDFVFYLNTSNDSETLVKLRKEGIVTALSKISNVDLKKDVIESLLYTFAQQEDIVMADYILKNQFTKLPISLQDYEFKAMVLDLLKTTVGVKAPDIVWEDKGTHKNLYSLKGEKYYLVVFWSTTCSHCLKEMPLLQKYLEDKPNIQVVAVALENKQSKIKWIDEKYYYEEFVHVLALSTTEDSVYRSKYVKDYGVNSTPNFFLLNSDKTIIAKPYDVKELKEIYPKLDK